MKFPKNLLHTGPVRMGVASVAAVGLLVALPVSAQATATPVPLGTAASFVVLAGETVTNTGATTLTGNVGVSPGSAIVGRETVTLTDGVYHAADPVAAVAQADSLVAYDKARLQAPATSVATELGGTTLKPGVYTSGKFGLTGTLTLDAGGDPNAIFVLQSADSLITASDSEVKLINGANPCNVFWQISKSATLGSGSSFTGNILALTSVSLATGATLEGRALARTGSVTLQANTITRPTCAPAETVTAKATATATATPTAQVTQVPKGAVSTGDGSANGGGNGLGLLSGLLASAGIAGAAVFATRRRRLNV